MEDSMSFRFRQARIARKLTQQELANQISNVADHVSVCRTSVTQWETGQTKTIEASNLLKAALVLKVCPYWLQFGMKQQSPLNKLENWVKQELVALKNNNANLAEYSDMEERIYGRFLRMIRQLEQNA